MKVSHYTAKCVRLRVEELERRIAPSYLVDAPGPFGLTVRGTNVSIPGVLRPANSARVLARLAPYSNLYNSPDGTQGWIVQTDPK
jgi:hypothetical protein